MAEPQHRILIAALRALPRNLLSRAAGRLAGVTLPRALRPALLGGFARLAGVDRDEVAAPLSDYPSLQAFFTRTLPEGARPPDPAPGALLSPCDGALGQAGRVSEGLALQLKGRPYAIADLLCDAAAAARFEGGRYATLYLSPRDYHRFHAPCDLEIERAVHVPGTLWPVNRAGLECVDGLFARNERICVHARGPGGALCVVAVGATLVGKVHLAFDPDLSTQTGAPGPRERVYPGVRLERGAELGHFAFGSTLVLLLAPGSGELDAAAAGAELRVGRRLGSLALAASER